MSKYGHIWQQKTNILAARMLKLRLLNRTSIFYIQSPDSILLISPRSTTDLDTHTHTNGQQCESYPDKHMWFISVTSQQSPVISLSVTVCAPLSPIFIFICHVMWEFWAPSPTVRAICAPLSLSNHPTNTHACTHAHSPSPPHILYTNRDIRTHTIALSAWQLNMGSMCLCFHSIACYSFLFPVSVLKGYLVPARAPVITITSLAEGRFSFLFIYRKFTIFDDLSFKTSSCSVLKPKVICVKIIPWGIFHTDTTDHGFPTFFVAIPFNWMTQYVFAAVLSS